MSLRITLQPATKENTGMQQVSNTMLFGATAWVTMLSIPGQYKKPAGVVYEITNAPEQCCVRDEEAESKEG